jgi:hypothetical protein
VNGLNRLAAEKSPYLLQHKDNPVHWYPWGEDAFAAARSADKPIFLSIGYSTCHWCHVMAHESFENDSVAELMNERFINVKVDREERPDVDHLYMKAVTAMNHGQGGWPLSVFLTPDLVPYFGGTYFPPRDRHGLPGFPTILTRMSEAYRTRKDDVARVTADVRRFLETPLEAGTHVPPPALLDTALRQLQGTFDRTWGGFGGAPKFPRSMTLSFLMRRQLAAPGPETLEMIKLTLDRMAEGGLYDHLGGGFHRYATDARWLVPHFEKMLYDNALLARAYLEAYQLTGEKRYAQVAREIFGYLRRDLRDPEGGYYAAEDADSEGEEGTFYLWTRSEIERHLGADAGLFCDYYQITPEGNFEGRSVLWAPEPLAPMATRHGLQVDVASRRLEAQRAQLLSVRSHRPRPHRDEKILTSWNGLALGAWALGFQVLNDSSCLASAREVARFLLERMWDGETLKARAAAGEVRFDGYLDDYAFTAWGLMDLYECTFEPIYLENAFDLMDAAERLFATPDGGYYFSPASNSELLARTQEVYDGALPSGASVMALNLLKRAEYTGVTAFRDRAEAVMQAYQTEISAHPAGYPQWLCALEFLYGRPREIVVAGSLDTSDPVWATIRGRFLPNKVLLYTADGRDAITRIAPVTAGKTGRDGRTLVYVCRDFACQAPAGDLEQLCAQLANEAGANAKGE